jgi:hypothetical protein
MNNGYKIDFAKNTITVNYKFAAAINEYSSEAYNIYKDIMKDFPQLRLVVKSGRKQTTPRYNKRFTYKNMEKYIVATCANADEVLQQFEIVKSKKEILASPYKYVCDWFKLQFPDYKEVSEAAQIKKVVSVQAAPNSDKYKQKEQKDAA